MRYFKIFEMFDDRGDLNYEINKKFEKAVKSNDLETVKRLLDFGLADPSYRNNAAYRHCWLDRRIDCMRLLLQDGRILNTLQEIEKQSALSKAVNENWPEMVQLYIDFGFKPRPYDINRAIKKQYQEIISILVKDSDIADEIDIVDLY